MDIISLAFFVRWIHMSPVDSPHTKASNAECCRITCCTNRRHFCVLTRLNVHETSLQWVPWGEYTLRLMGRCETPLSPPAIRSVSSSISWRTWSKSVKVLPLQWRNSAYSEPELLWISWRIRGRRVTMPEPRGKKSLQMEYNIYSWGPGAQHTGACVAALRWGANG